VAKVWSGTAAPVSASSQPWIRKRQHSEVFCSGPKPAAAGVQSVSRVFLQLKVWNRCCRYMDTWPVRAKVPSVWDIVAFRSTLPVNVTPSKVLHLAKQKPAWSDEKAVTSACYIQGVVAGYDNAKHSLLDN